MYQNSKGLSGGSEGKESGCNAGDLGSIPGLERFPGEQLCTPVFWPGEFHGQRSLAGSVISWELAGFVTTVSQRVRHH